MLLPTRSRNSAAIVPRRWSAWSAASSRAWPLPCASPRARSQHLTGQSDQLNRRSEIPNVLPAPPSSGYTTPRRLPVGEGGRGGSPPPASSVQLLQQLVQAARPGGSAKAAGGFESPGGCANCPPQAGHASVVHEWDESKRPGGLTSCRAVLYNRLQPLRVVNRGIWTPTKCKNPLFSRGFAGR
jgi:hypothetical protein